MGTFDIIVALVVGAVLIFYIASGLAKRYLVQMTWVLAIYFLVRVFVGIEDLEILNRIDKLVAFVMMILWIQKYKYLQGGRDED
ncbi:hypothetical protein [uncultured Ezakiella sp.]|uniref:hypothetical protein n=1 Tax=uncultured Ezakiella sp. TaxID=1637529 RepID=UPI0025D402EA|nr:hypothetical protein [uncultured Ezakiella sp.]